MRDINSLLQGLKEGKYENRLKEIYIDEEMLEYQTRRYEKALKSFKEKYGDYQVEIYSAPGRSEVGGNHTDHQLGKVLAASVNLDAIAVVAKCETNIIHIFSEGYGELIIDLTDLDPREEEISDAKALIRGIVARIKELGYHTGGFLAYVTSDVLSGSGLSSSAAFETLIATIISGLYNQMEIDSMEIAMVGQYAENIYFGKPCGLMDQMACSVGGMIFIDFEKPNLPKIRPIDTDFSKFEHTLCITDTKGTHADLTNDYAAIPRDMGKVAKYFGKQVLREVKENEFYNHIAKIREDLGDRCVLRAMHYFDENQRVDKQVESLEAGDFSEFKKYIRKSGDSSYKYLQNVFSPHKVEEQGISVALALSEMFHGENGVSRVHGGGFAGTIQAFVPDSMVQEYRHSMERVFGINTCYILKIRKYGGTKVM